MANTKNYTEHGGSITHIGGELVLDPGSKIIKDGQEIDIGGSLPPVEGSAKALVSVNGEWVEQDGYGYTEKGGQTVITWDGDTEGRDILVLHGSYGDGIFCKVAEKQSEYPENASIEMDFGEGTESVDAELTEYIGTYAYSAFGQPIVLIANAGDIEIGPFAGNAPSAGVYFFQNPDGANMNAMSLTYVTPDTVHKIDPKYIPEIIVDVVEEDGGYSSSLSFNEIKQYVEKGYSIKARIVIRGETILVPMTSYFLR